MVFDAMAAQLAEPSDEHDTDLSLKTYWKQMPCDQDPFFWMASGRAVLTMAGSAGR